jgi:hypothetical protein
MIWRGYGALLIGVVFASSLAANLIANLAGGAHYWDTHGWPIAATFGVDAIVLWLADIFLEKRQQPRTLIDEATGERFIVNRRHEFLFLRIRWWAFIFLGLGFWVLLSGWSPGHR